jgi:hypothetical protein
MRISGSTSHLVFCSLGRTMSQIASVWNKTTCESSFATRKPRRVDRKVRKSENFGADFERMSIGVHSPVGCVYRAATHRLPARDECFGAFARDRPVRLADAPYARNGIYMPRHAASALQVRWVDLQKQKTPRLSDCLQSVSRRGPTDEETVKVGFDFCPTREL